MTATLSGQVLRAWREYAGFTGAQLARAVQKERSTVTMWESGERGRKSAASLGTVEDLAALYLDRAEHFTQANATAMVGMWSAAASVNALPPRTLWFHNFPQPPGPVWVWLRGRPESTDRRAELKVGPFDQTLPVPDTEGGVMVHSPTSIPNPPLTVTFAEPGWVDCGTGVVPQQVADALGIDMIDTRDIVGRHPPRYRLLDKDSARQLNPALWAVRQITERFQVSWSLIAPHIGDSIRPDHPAHAIDGDSVALLARPGQPMTDPTGAVISQMMMSPEQAQAVREGRGLTRAAAAERATTHDPHHPVTPKNLENLEHGGRLPEAECTLARLDMVYNTDGRLGIDRTFNSRNHPAAQPGRFALKFPTYWVGHVWVQAHGPDLGGTCVMELVWGPWKRRQRISSGMVLTTRKAGPGTEPPLIVSLPPGWHLTAGTGLVPAARDINVGWRPTNWQAAWALVFEVGSAMLGKALRAKRRPGTDNPSGTHGSTTLRDTSEDTLDRQTDT